MAGFETYVEATDPIGATMPELFSDYAITATNDATTAIVWAHSTDGLSIMLMAVDYTDPTNVRYGAVVSLALSDASTKYTIVPLPGSDGFIVSGVTLALGDPHHASHSWYAVYAFDPTTLAITAVTGWQAIDVSGTVIISDGFDGFMWPISGTEFITTARSGLGGSHVDTIVKLDFDGTTLTIVAETTAYPGVRGLVDAIVQGTDVYSVANPLISGDGSLWRIDGAALTASSLTVDLLGQNHLWRVDAAHARLHVLDFSGSTPIVGFRDVDLASGTVSAPNLYTEAFGDWDFQPCVSGDGTVTFWNARGGGTTAADGDTHPRAQPVATTPETAFGPAQPIPVAGSHALGIWATIGDPHIVVGRLSERPVRRWTELDPGAPHFGDALVGQQITVDEFVDYDTTGERPASIDYWRPILSWQLDWGDGTSRTGVGPFPEGDHGRPQWVGHREHIYRRPGTFEARLHIIDAVAASLTADETPAIFTIGPAPPQRQYPRDDGLGASTRRSWPPPTSKQYSTRRGPVATYE